MFKSRLTYWVLFFWIQIKFHSFSKKKQVKISDFESSDAFNLLLKRVKKFNKKIIAFIFNVKGDKAFFIKITFIKKTGYVSFKAFSLINITFIKKTGYAPFRASNLINLTPVKKISCASFEVFNTKNSILIKIIQPALATLKVIPAKVKRAAAAYFKKVN